MINKLSLIRQFIIYKLSFLSFKALYYIKIKVFNKRINLMLVLIYEKTLYFNKLYIEIILFKI